MKLPTIDSAARLREMAFKNVHYLKKNKKIG
jgi:hypothetical protein